jgi:alkylated DNA repair dioxygenase AlkB
MNKTNIIQFPHMENSHIVYYENFFPEDISDQYFLKLKNEIDWKQESMLMYGKSIDFPRLTAWYGEEGKSYKFSGITLQPEDWTKMPTIFDIKKEIEFESLGTKFNSVLLNYYRNGRDSISWHSDKEKELGKNPVISSVTLGCEREFKMRRFDDNSDVHSIMLKHGSLLVMSGETQHFWQHSIPKQSLKKDLMLDLFSSEISSGEERINLTFRHIQ